MSLHFDSDGQGGNIIVFSGDAELARDVPPAHAMAPYADKYRDGFRRIGVSPEQFSQAYPLPVRIRPRSVRGH